MAKVMVFDALGTRWWIESWHGLDKSTQAAVKDTVKAFENNYSRFKETSQLARLNNEKVFLKPSSELRSLVQYGIDLFTLTEGIFNFSVGSKLEQDGYGKKADQEARISQNLTEEIKISLKEIRLAPHIRLDFGGFGKGWLIDLLGAVLLKSGIDDYIINGGGDILVGGKRTELFIEHPLDQSLQIGSMKLANQALASSSRQKRSWKANGQDKNHIINAKETAIDEVLSVHVLAPSTLQADTFATVLLLVDQKKRLEMARHFDFEFMTVNKDLTIFQTAKFGFRQNA